MLELKLAAAEADADADADNGAFCCMGWHHCSLTVARIFVPTA